MQTAFPPSDYYEASAPPEDHQLTTSLPATAPVGQQGGRPGWFPRSPWTDRRGRCPAIPRPPRHEYAAGFPRGLPTGVTLPAPELTATCGHRSRTAHRPISTRFESARRLRDFTRWFLSYTFSSCLPDPRRLAVPTRPVVVRTASHPPRRPPDPAVLSFNQAAATAQRQGPPTPARSHWRLVAHVQVVEPASWILTRPTVQFDLHLSYRPEGRIDIRPLHGTGVHRCIFEHCILSLTDTLPVALPHVRGLSPARSTTTAPPHPHPSAGIGLIHPLLPGWGQGDGTHADGSQRSLLSGRRVRHPALPLRHHHGYAVDWP